MTMSLPDVNAERPTTRRRLMPRPTPRHWLEVAAAVAVIIVISPALIGRLSQTGVPDRAALIPSLTITDSLAINLVAQPIWAPTLGDGEGELASTARAVRLGSMIASYEILRERAGPAAGAAAVEVARMLETYPGGVDAGYAYRSLATRVPADSEVDAAARLAERLAGARPVRLGAWLQGARFAAAGSNAAWFAENTGRAIWRSALIIDDRADTEMAAKQFEHLMKERPHDFTAIGTSVEELLRLLGTR
jgi:hypothetical protein